MTMTEDRVFPRQAIELAQAAYGPRSVKHFVGGMAWWTGVFDPGYAANVATVTFTVYGSPDGFTKARTIGTVAAAALTATASIVEESVLSDQWVIIEMTAFGTSGVVWISGVAKAE